MQNQPYHKIQNIEIYQISKLKNQIILYYSTFVNVE